MIYVSTIHICLCSQFWWRIWYSDQYTSLFNFFCAHQIPELSGNHNIWLKDTSILKKQIIAVFNTQMYTRISFWMRKFFSRSSDFASLLVSVIDNDTGFNRLCVRDSAKFNSIKIISPTIWRRSRVRYAEMNISPQIQFFFLFRKRQTFSVHAIPETVILILTCFISRY